MRTTLAALLLVVTGCDTYVVPGAPEAEEQFIVGGSDAPSGVYRHQVSLQDRSGFHFCGGSLVADGWVLTAAHCVQGESPSGLRVEADITRLSSSGQLFDVSRILVHPSYSSSTSDNDVALLQLSRSTGAVPPIVLMDAAAEGGLAAPGVRATVTGWGTLTSGGSSPDKLQMVQVPIVTESSCQASYPRETITDGMLCAGEAGKDSCQGDSGGPMVVDGAGGLVLAGVVSWGYGCADARYPGVYARVSHFGSWIAGHVPSVRFVSGDATEPDPDPEPEPGDDHGDDAAGATAVHVAGTVVVQGSLDAGDKDVFRIELDGSGRFTAATASGVDTFGTLRSAAGATVATDDDSGADLNFSLATDATGEVLLLEVRGYDARAVGAYTLTLTGPEGATEPPPSDADIVLDLRSQASATFAVGDAVEAGAADEYTIEVLANGPVTLTAASAGSTDTLGTLSDEAGDVLATSDDEGPGLNFQLSASATPGLYLLEVRGYNARVTGAYDLEVSARR